MELVPGVFMASSPCARLPTSFPKSLAHESCRSGSACSFLYCEMDSPVTGWMTGAQNGSQVHWILCIMGSLVCLLIAMVVRVAAEYCHGERSVMPCDWHGTRCCGSASMVMRGIGAFMGVVVGCTMGTSAGVSMGAVIGVGRELLHIGVMLLCVCR